MILRIYADADGESHFEDVEFVFEQTDLVPPAPPVLMTALEGASRYGFELVHPGWHGDWHPVPQRLLAVYLSGAGTMEASDGELRDLRPGTILLAEDTTGKGHISQVTGDDDMLVLILMLPDPGESTLTAGRSQSHTSSTVHEVTEGQDSRLAEGLCSPSKLAA